MRYTPRKILLASLTAAALLTSPLAMANQSIEQKLNQAQTAYNRQDYQTAFHIVSELAHQGNARAQYKLGVLYEEGRGVAQDNRQAVAWYQKAANQGYAAAQNNLGNMYSDGRGVAQDYHQALAWYQKAANQGDAAAQFNLGFMYEEERGVAQDYQQVRYWWQKAASQTKNAEARQKAQEDLQYLKQMGK